MIKIILNGRGSSEQVFTVIDYRSVGEIKNSSYSLHTSHILFQRLMFADENTGEMFS